MSTQWRKSSHSSNGTDCVEVSSDLNALRDSKNSDGPVLRVALADLLTALKSGRVPR